MSASGSELIRVLKTKYQFVRDELGRGWGVRSEEGPFVRVKPFWVGDQELEEVGVQQGSTTESSRQPEQPPNGP